MISAKDKRLLEVEVIQARNVVSRNGISVNINSFCLLTVDEVNFEQTPVIYGSTSPEWNTKLEFPLTVFGNNTLTVKLYNKDDNGFDSLFGSLSISLESCTNEREERMYKLPIMLDAANDDDLVAELKLALRLHEEKTTKNYFISNIPIPCNELEERLNLSQFRKKAYYQYVEAPGVYMQCCLIETTSDDEMMAISAISGIVIGGVFDVRVVETSASIGSIETLTIERRMVIREEIVKQVDQGEIEPSAPPDDDFLIPGSQILQGEEEPQKPPVPKRDKKELLVERCREDLRIRIEDRKKGLYQTSGGGEIVGRSVDTAVDKSVNAVSTVASGTYKAARSGVVSGYQSASKAVKGVKSQIGGKK